MNNEDRVQLSIPLRPGIEATLTYPPDMEPEELDFFMEILAEYKPRITLPRQVGPKVAE